MDLIKGSLKNPVARFMMAIGIILLGIIAFQHLAIDLFPDISYPIVSVSTEYEGASPEDIEISLTRPIEKRVSRIQNVRHVSSRSREGMSTVMLEFYWGTNLDVASTDIQQAINQINDSFPEEAKESVIYKFDPSSISVLGPVRLRSHGRVPPPGACRRLRRAPAREPQGGCLRQRPRRTGPRDPGGTRTGKSWKASICRSTGYPRPYGPATKTCRAGV